MEIASTCMCIKDKCRKVSSNFRKMFTNRPVSHYVSDRMYIHVLGVCVSAAAVEVMNSDKPSHLLSIILWCNI